MALRDQPYLPLYVDDYLTDEKLAMCSDATQGIYVKIMCNLHKQTPYGGLLLKQKDKQDASNIRNFAVKLSNLIPRSVEVLEQAITELVTERALRIGTLTDGKLPTDKKGEFLTDPDGDFLFQKRMYRDGVISSVRSETGKEGGRKTADRYFAEAKQETNPKQNHVNVIEDVIVNESSKEEGVQGEIPTPEFYPFDAFWNDYDKKRGDLTKLKAKWGKIPARDRKLIQEYIPRYKASQPDKKFRKDPETFLNNHSWLDEIVDDKNNNHERTTTKTGGQATSFRQDANERRASVTNAKNLAVAVLLGSQPENAD